MSSVVRNGGEHRGRVVEVRGLSPWVALNRLLGPGDWAPIPSGDVRGELVVRARLDTLAAARLAARLRGLVLGGRELEFSCVPPLSRAHKRSALLQESRARRSTSPGFVRKGVRIDEEGRYSLTPEAIAVALGQAARRRWGDGLRVADTTCALGGNTIGFARAGAQVTAYELDGDRLGMARHNAGIYGVAEAIRFEHADARAQVGASDPQLVYVDPPWGRDWKAAGARLAPPTLLLELGERWWTWIQAARPDGLRALWAKVPPALDSKTVDFGAGQPACRPVFGTASGDAHRVKFLWLAWSWRAETT